jgi:hypothetical protein
VGVYDEILCGDLINGGLMANDACLVPVNFELVGLSTWGQLQVIFGRV